MFIDFGLLWICVFCLDYFWDLLLIFFFWCWGLKEGRVCDRGSSDGIWCRDVVIIEVSVVKGIKFNYML